MGTGRKKGPGGGGASLNFKVVGNPQPANPKPNTIWVDTDVKITGHYFQAEQPENMAEGEVWFSTGTASQVAFNALKKGGTVMVYPISAKQMQGGTLVDVTAKSWRAGEWIDWIDWDSFIIYEGVARRELKKNSSNNISITQNADNVYITSDSDGYWTVWVDDADLTNAKTLVIEGTFAVNYTMLHVWENSIATPSAGNAKAKSDITATGGSLDVSNFSGLYKVGFSWQSSREHKITGFRYEK